MTGREREQLVLLLASGRDFRFEAGRRIRFERRGALLTVRRAPAPRRAVYDSEIGSSEAPAGAGIAS